MTLNSQEAKLILILLGRDRESAILPSDYTAQHTLALIERLKAVSQENA